MNRALYLYELPARMREERARRRVAADVAAIEAKIGVAAWERLEASDPARSNSVRKLYRTHAAIIIAVAQWLGVDVVIPSSVTADRGIPWGTE